MSNKSTFQTYIGGKKKHIHTSLGKCSSKNVIYLVLCKCCRKYYVGRTTQPLNVRTNLHRGCFIRYVKTNGDLVVPSAKLDNFALGMHLFNEHGLKTKQQFDEAFELYILEVCSPKELDVKEHMWIQRLRALAPNGLNLCSSYGLPLLS